MPRYTSRVDTYASPRHNLPTNLDSVSDDAILEIITLDSTASFTLIAGFLSHKHSTIQRPGMTHAHNFFTNVINVHILAYIDIINNYEH